MRTTNTTTVLPSKCHGNDGGDTIGNSQIGLLATLSTVSGGQGVDDIFIGSLQRTKVNGNLAAVGSRGAPLLAGTRAR